VCGEHRLGSKLREEESSAQMNNEDESTGALIADASIGVLGRPGISGTVASPVAILGSAIARPTRRIDD